MVLDTHFPEEGISQLKKEGMLRTTIDLCNLPMPTVTYNDIRDELIMIK